MSLHPRMTVQKALISTTSRLLGAYEADGMLVSHAWPDFYGRSASMRTAQSPASRSAFIFAFETEPVEPAPGVMVPNYSHLGKLLCSYLSVLFGKRFDSHGLVEHSGIFQVPDMAEFSELCDPLLPQNSHSPRVDFGIPLNLVEMARIKALLDVTSLDQRIANVFQGASKFYLQGLQNAERDPEVAYLHLITAGEILSSAFDFEQSDILDSQAKSFLSRIRDASSDGPELASLVSTRLLQVKRRFVQAILRLVDPGFFARSEASTSFGRFREETFTNVIAAAYDLRSRYVHTGIPFGRWIWHGAGGSNNEVQEGRPVVSDADFGKILAKAPTYVGLERVVRYSLLRFAETQGLYVEPASDGVSGRME